VVANFLFKDRDGQTLLPPELLKGLKIKTIQTLGELDEYEEANIAKGLAWLAASTQDNDLVYGFWLKVHKKLFGEIWSWAGKIRQHELNNPDFAASHQIWPAIQLLETNLSFWIENNTFSLQEIGARFHEALITMHPFANGNGRFSRILIENFFEKRKAKIPSWGAVSASVPVERRKAYIQSIERGRFNKQYSELVAFMFS
jgi:Fic-DOC domain mobile mystery protein B